MVNGFLITWFILILFNIILSAYKHGKPQPDYNLWNTLIGSVISLFLILGMMGWTIW